MKELKNARLHNVRMTMDIEEGPTLVLDASLECSNNGEKYDFCFSFSPTAVSDSTNRLLFLMRYTKALDVPEMNGEIIRVVIDETNNIYAFGDAINNCFFNYEGSFRLAAEEDIMKE